MKKIEWHKVTRFSKFLALTIFVVFPFVGFYFGLQVGRILEIAGTVQVAPPAPPAQTAADEYYSNVSEWQQYQQGSAFTFSYPIDFQVDSQWNPAAQSDWRLNADGKLGIKYATLTIPRAFEPDTNFADATLTIGKSDDPSAVSQCLTPDQGGETNATSTVLINGVNFFKTASEGAGAGNYYETTGYRTLHGGCLSVEYTIHSTQIANYPEAYHLKPFDKNKVVDLMDRIVGTFNVL